MIDIDPASPEFEALPHPEQARIYRANGWSFDALASEFDRPKSTVRFWADPEYRAWHIAHKTEQRRAKRAALRQAQRGE